MGIDEIINKYGVDDQKKLNIPPKNTALELINFNFLFLNDNY